MADDKEPKSGGENLVPDGFDFDNFIDNANVSDGFGDFNDSGDFPMEEPVVETEPVAEIVDADNTEEFADVVEEPADAVPPVDDLSEADQNLWAARRFFDRIWMGVAGVGVVALAVANVLLFLSPPAVCSFTTKLYFFMLFNITGLAAVAVPLTLWRAGAKLDIRKDRDKAQLAIQEKSWLPNVALSLAMMAVCVAVMVLLAEFYQYDFTMKAK